MYPNPQENEATDIHEFVQKKQQAFQRAFEFVRRNLNEKQNRRNAIYIKKVHGPIYKEGQKVLPLSSIHRFWNDFDVRKPLEGTVCH